MFHPKKIVSVLGITALLLGSVAPMPFDLGAGPAFANNGNGGGGGGNGGGGGGGNGGGGGGGGKGGEKSAGKAGGNGNGGEKAVERTVTREKPSAAKPKAQQVAPAEDVGEITLAARDLGNMNGAMNANINAVLAHIRNGNYNGPVGAVAGLAAADAQAGDLDSADVLARAEAWESWRGTAVNLLGADYPTVLDAYVADRAEYDAYQTALGTWNTANEAYQAALADPAVAPEDAEALNPGPAPMEVVFQPDDGIEALLAGQPVVTEPTPEELDLVNAVSDAEAAVLALWNKNPNDVDGMSAEEQALLDQLRARFSASDLEAIVAASGS
ncbi:MAG: hypothetical protein O9328_08475 [Rhodobacteraceae bacterium]|nr:hypothetical protein [Paracoccaceae bacterium]